MEARVVVLGVGNILLRDEGVGIHVVRRLQEMELPKCVKLVDGGTAGFGLVSVVSSAGRLIVVDALDAAGPPGTVVRLDSRDLRRKGAPTSSPHEAGVLDVLELAGLEGPPPETTIFGVVPESIEWGTELTSAVERAVADVVRLVLQEISGLC